MYTDVYKTVWMLRTGIPINNSVEGIQRHKTTEGQQGGDHEKRL